MENLIVNRREKKVNHDAPKSRRKGRVPGILYGKDVTNYMFEVGSLELNSHIADIGEHGILNIELDGQTHRTLIKELQRDPVQRQIIHIDLEELPKDKVIHTEVPIMFIGEEMVAKNGGVAQKEKSSVKVQCKSEEIPRTINVDLSKMAVGQVYRIQDIEMAQEITFTEPLNSVIVSIAEFKKMVDIAEEALEG